MSASTASLEPIYEVVWPLGASAIDTRAPNERIADLSGKTIGELWDYVFHGDKILSILREKLVARFPGIRFVPYDVFGNLHGSCPRCDSMEDLRRKVEDVLLPQIISGLSHLPGGQSATARVSEPAPRDLVFRGTLDEVNAHFQRKLWADGLPIMPPTLASVERFLAFTDRAPDEVIGRCPVANRLATVWNVAVNGVMAGCRPEYLPVLLAVVEAITDPACKIEDAGSTPGWESLIVVSGPIAKELAFNSGQGVMRPGFQANTSVDRFLRLFLRNIDNLFNPDPYYQQGGDMVCVGGMRYAIDPKAAMGARITRMEIAGKPIDAQQKCKVAGWAPVSEEAKAAGGEPIWEVCARYLRAQKTIPPPALSLPVIEGMAGNPGTA